MVLQRSPIMPVLLAGAEAQAIAEELAASGLAVVIARDTEEAASLLAGGAPTLFYGVKLGPAPVAALRAGFPHLQIVAIATAGDGEALIAALSAGADWPLLRPFDAARAAALVARPIAMGHKALRSELLRAAASGHDFALLLVDLDRFRQINEAYGPAVGDRVLAAAADRLGRAAERAWLVSWLGGDEFGIVVPEEAASEVAWALKGALRDGIDLSGERIPLRASIAIAPFRSDVTPDRLLVDAGVALRVAKQKGGDRIEIVTPAQREASRHRLDLAQRLERALDDGGIATWLQPIVRLNSGEVVGFEALARWQDAAGVIPPSEFIPVAEEEGLIGRIGAFVLEAACTAAAGWPRPAFISVNLSAHQLDDEAVFAQVERALERSGLDPRRLKLEITESAIMRDPEAAEAILARLRARGIGIAIDDFGTGYSSLAYLHRFRAETLKIDRSFVSSLSTPSGLAIVSAITALARSLQMEVVAEGVETHEQRRTLEMLGCGMAQGYLYGKPLPAAAATAMLERVRKTG